MSSNQELLTNNLSTSTKELSALSTGLLPIAVGGVIGVVGLFLSPLFALFCVVAFGTIVLFLTRPMTVCYMLIGAIALTSGMERGAILPLLKPNEIAFLVALGVTIALALISPKIRLNGGSYLLFCSAVLGLGTFFIPLTSYIIRGVDLATDDILILIAPLQYFLLFWIFSTVPREDYQRYKLVLIMIAAGSFVALVGLLQGANLSFVQSLLDAYYPSSHGARADEVGRVTSLLGAWNATGIFLMVTALLGWGFLPVAKSGKDKTVVTCAIGLSILGLIATGSFAGMGTLMVGFILLVMIQGQAGRVLPVLVVSVFLVIALLFVLQPIVGPLIEQRLDYQFSGKRGQSGWIPQTLTFRFDVWREHFWPAIRENPLWGIKPTIPDGFGWHAYESQYIGLLFSTGAVGLVAWAIWWFGSCMWLAQLRARLVGLNRSIGTVTLILLSVMAVAGLTNAVFTFAGSIDYLWILLAITASGAYSDELDLGETKKVLRSNR